MQVPGQRFLRFFMVLSWQLRLCFFLGPLTSYHFQHSQPFLIATGLKLASPNVVAELWRAGRYQFVPWLVTLLAIVLTDPLIGILIGLAVSTIFILWSNLRRPFAIGSRASPWRRTVTRIELASQVSFLNRATLRKAFDNIESGKHFLVDAPRYRIHRPRYLVFD